MIASPREHWTALPSAMKGAALVSLGSLTLVVMAVLTKSLGARLSSFEILFFRSAVGFVFLFAPFSA
jgi:hypothetical protein